MVFLTPLDYIDERATQGCWDGLGRSVALQRISIRLGLIDWVQQSVHWLNLPQLEVPFCGDDWGCPMWRRLSADSPRPRWTRQAGLIREHRRYDKRANYGQALQLIRNQLGSKFSIEEEPEKLERWSCTWTVQ